MRIVGRQKYQIRAEVDTDIKEKWLKWMHEVHIPEVIEAGVFLGCELEAVTQDSQQAFSTYIMSYVYQHRKTMDRYLDSHANRLRDDHMENFPEGVRASREFVHSDAFWGFGVNKQVYLFWQAFARRHQLDANQTPNAWSFGDNPDLADELLELVLTGKKTATSSLFKQYQLEDDIPKIGEYCILLNSKSIPKAVIQVTKLELMPFSEVTETVARAEGEGDLSLEFWKEAHLEFFKRQVDDFSEGDLILVETFKILL